jgi:hypothetical protein
MAESSRPVPKFTANSELARHVGADLCPRGRVSSAAYHRNDGESYLSVNSLDLESLEKLTPYFRNLLQDGIGAVAIHCRKISHYNSAAADAGISIKYNSVGHVWEYLIDRAPTAAYKHRPTQHSVSHCGVEFISAPEYVEKKFARRIAIGKPHIRR